MKIIAIGHYRRVGKDTFANSVINQLQVADPTIRVAKLPWAWKLKQVTHDLYAHLGLREPEFYETEEGAALREIPLPGINKSPRQIWIDFGTPAVRERVYDRTWVEYNLKGCGDKYDVILIPDTRFYNEVFAVEEADGERVKIVRPGYGPGPNRPDRELLGYTGWTNVIGETGEIKHIEQWASRYVAWILGGPRVTRSQADMERALKVEVIEPWEAPEDATQRSLIVEPDEVGGLMETIAAAWSESQGGHTPKLQAAIREHYPHIAKEYSYMWTSA